MDEDVWEALQRARDDMQVGKPIRAPDLQAVIGAILQLKEEVDKLKGHSPST